MSVKVRVSGVSKMRAKAKDVQQRLNDEMSAAVEAEADAVVDDARSYVRVRTGDLRDSITAKVNGLRAEVRPRSSASGVGGARHGIKANVNEHGRVGDPGQPYMTPAAERSRQRWPKRVQEAVERGARG